MQMHCGEMIKVSPTLPARRALMRGKKRGFSVNKLVRLIFCNGAIGMPGIFLFSVRSLLNNMNEL